MGDRERLDALSGEAKVWVGLSDSHEQPANLATVLRKALGGAFACSLMDRIRDPCSLLLKYTLQVMFGSASWPQDPQEQAALWALRWAPLHSARWCGESLGMLMGMRECLAQEVTL